MNWTLDQLRAFVVSAELGSFSAAGRRLGKVQSRISSAIADLEVDLGFDLFDRSGKYPTLTDGGKELLVEATAVLNQCERLQAMAEKVSNHDETSLSITCDEAISIEAFDKFIIDIAEKYPGLKLTVTNGSRDDIATAVVECRADIGITFRQSELSPALEFESIGHLSNVLVISPHHPLAKKKRLTLKDLQPLRQLVICDKKGTGRGTPLTPDYWHIDSYFFISELVMHGLGWAIIPDHVANSSWYDGSLKIYPVSQLGQSVVMEVGLVKRRDKPLSPISSWLLQQMKTRFDGR
ncbi:LysR family transcriptional regulator [Enterovibrio sp. ZSDZ35]|uniref:LysR family transcriptional regulator n=1 Tax=Enterovibrio qingdaonensis TaxID=2899818 RepID=A0ABT5QIY5_9GAMM|nr:LysR family transcriptional regulator [Enterovibrio sp. ZSDZ35]MDD1780952.1 LysR family transcriptional regulator [Enterovibrio sp. ZSDZ35]